MSPTLLLCNQINMNTHLDPDTGEQIIVLVLSSRESPGDKAICPIPTDQLREIAMACIVEAASVDEYNATLDSPSKFDPPTTQ